MSANLLRVSRRLRWVAVTIPATPPPTTTIRCISVALLHRFCLAWAKSNRSLAHSLATARHLKVSIVGACLDKVVEPGRKTPFGLGLVPVNDYLLLFDSFI